MTPGRCPTSHSTATVIAASTHQSAVLDSRSTFQRMVLLLLLSRAESAPLKSILPQAREHDSLPKDTELEPILPLRDCACLMIQSKRNTLETLHVPSDVPPSCSKLLHGARLTYSTALTARLPAQVHACHQYRAAAGEHSQAAPTGRGPLLLLLHPSRQAQHSPGGPGMQKPAAHPPQGETLESSQPS